MAKRPVPTPTMPECWRIAEAVIAHTPRLLLAGPPGTGKTRLASRAALPDGGLVYSITLTEETPATELRGHYVPSDGRFIWTDGPALSAWRAGARLVLNEIDHAGADALSILHVILDDAATASLTLPTGETVRPAPGFTVVATMNGEPESLPPALRDRFPVALTIDRVHHAALAQLPADLRVAAAESAICPPERRVSIRVWQAFASLRERLQNEDDAALACFGPRATDALAAIKLARAER